jgi:hypothetical protein
MCGRLQCVEILAYHLDATMSRVCGVPHLLRFSVPLGAVLVSTLWRKRICFISELPLCFLMYRTKPPTARDFEVCPPDYYWEAV